MICPDDKSECPDGYTCCLSSDSNYKCCPVPDAHCCSDKIHCCPGGFKCDSGKCVNSNANLVHPLIELSSLPSGSVKDDIVCPDKKYYCYPTQTCCRVSAEEYGCCNIQNAVCCTDMKSCCSPGNVCDFNKNGCVPPSIETQAQLILKPAAKEAQGDNGSEFCPDGSQCSDGCTCCMTKSGYGCCEMYEAVCCADLLHCCPEGSVCDGDKCISVVHPLLRLNSAPLIREVESKDVL